MKTIYLAGQITGDPYYKKKFLMAETLMTQAGYAVVSPAYLPAQGLEYEAYMRIGAAMLAECSAICLLPDWIHSPGAMRECIEAKARGKEIILFSDLYPDGLITEKEA